MLKEAVRTAEEEAKATVFGYWVSDPERYGVAELMRLEIAFPLKKSQNIRNLIMP